MCFYFGQYIFLYVLTEMEAANQAATSTFKILQLVALHDNLGAGAHRASEWGDQNIWNICLNALWFTAATEFYRYRIKVVGFAERNKKQPLNGSGKNP